MKSIRHHFRPDSPLHTLAGYLIMAAIVLLLPFIFAVR